MEKQLFSAVYQQRRTFQVYSKEEGTIIGYLNEEVLENYEPENRPEEGESTAWAEAFRYTGTEHDGGTIMKCTDTSDHGELTNAIIRTRYSESQELAIHRHAANGDYSEDTTEFDEYNDFCESAKTIARNWMENV